MAIIRHSWDHFKRSLPAEDALGSSGLNVLNEQPETNIDRLRQVDSVKGRRICGGHQTPRVSLETGPCSLRGKVCNKQNRTRVVLQAHADRWPPRAKCPG